MQAKEKSFANSGIDAFHGRARLTGKTTVEVGADRHAAHKVLIDKQDDHIVGAHLLGPHSEEVINVFAVAMQSGMRASDLKQMRFAYPTSTSDVGSML